MAEGYAKAYGSDAMKVMSAGLYPASTISRLTQEVMSEKNITLDEHFPKALNEVPWDQFDLVVNISGHMLPLETKARVVHWEIEDPIGAKKDTFLKVAQQVEMQVMQLILQIRKDPASVGGAAPPKRKRRKWFGI
jgi:arsenate reductase (thioredoxin)